LPAGSRLRQLHGEQPSDPEEDVEPQKNQQASTSNPMR
jgi:hypothetical protein